MTRANSEVLTCAVHIVPHFEKSEVMIMMKKVNANVKSFKARRELLGAWHVAMHSVHDTKLESNELLNSLRSQLKTYNERLEKINNGHHGLGTADEVSAKIDAVNADIKNEVDACVGRVDIYADAIKSAEDTVSKEFCKAIVAYANNVYDSANEISALTAIVSWFKDGGLDIDTDMASDLLRNFGSKKSNHKTACQKYRHTQASVSVKTVPSLFISSVCDHPSINSVLPLYKYEYVFEEKALKRGRKANEESEKSAN